MRGRHERNREKMKKQKNKSGNLKGIRIRTFNYIMIAAACVLYAFILHETIQISVRYRNLLSSTEDYISTEESASMLNEGSDILTNSVRLYVVTANPDYAEAYFTEANVDRRRDRALETLNEFHQEDSIRTYLNDALDYSNELMQREIYAMKLVTVAQGYSLDDFPEEIRNEQLTDEDKRLSVEEKMKKAEELVFDNGYRDAKALIQNQIGYSLDAILDRMQKTQKENSEMLESTIVQQRIYISILFAMNIAVFFFITILIVKPLQIYVNCINKNKTLEILGSYEFKYLALTYNSIYEINAANEVMLRKNAEHDALTGVMNRRAFDQVRSGLEKQPGSFALMLVDVDEFKTVNDTFGHEAGDRVLKKVAEILNDSFRSSDFVARIGGDEFAVIMMDVDSGKCNMIRNKIKEMNQKLGLGEEGLPPVSLSIGAAFTDKGFHSELFNEADSALYLVKQNGRSGCAFYGDGRIYR